jgi:hypothetical protein
MLAALAPRQEGASLARVAEVQAVKSQDRPL